MDPWENSYIKIKKLYQRETIMLCVLNILIGVVFLSAFRKAEPPADKAELYLMCVMGAIVALLVLYGVIGAIIRTVRWNKMLESLGCRSDEDAEWMLSHAKPLDQPSSHYFVPHYYIMEDRLINFTTAKTYEIRKICRIQKKAYSRSKSFKKNYGMDIKLSCSPYRDRIILAEMEERDMIYNRIVSVFERYGGDDRIL